MHKNVLIFIDIIINTIVFIIINIIIVHNSTVKVIKILKRFLGCF